MKRLFTRLYRALMFMLGMLPVICALSSALGRSFLTGLFWTAGQTVIASLFTLLPAFVGNYREYEVVSYENHRASLDPDPDREVRRERVREGHRFPLRLTADLILLAVNVLALSTLGRERFVDGSMFCKLGFMAAQTVFMMMAMNNIAMAQCLWLDIPGVVFGAAGYLGMAIYLRAGSPEPGLTAVITAAAVVYLFLGAVTLNRQSIAISMATHTGEMPRAPRQIARRNKRIVLGFAGTVTVVSLLSPIRDGLLWLLARAGELARLLLRLIGISGESGALGDMPMEVMDAAGETAPAAVMEAVEESAGSYIIVYIFFGILAVGVIWMLFDLVRKIVNKLTVWMEKFASGVSEGFYDEREQLMTADEMMDRLRKGMRDRVKALFTREKRWDELTGRERARRLLRDFYKKRAWKLKNLKTLTAREALAAAESRESERFGELYDRARYSSREVDPAEADQLKKDLKL